jgi:NADH dehydrogenase FAD-containing subunit
VISSETQVTYRPWLIRVPGGGAPPPLISFGRPIAAAGAEVIASSATGVDVDGQRLVLDSGGEIEYDQLVVATGASADRDRVPGAHDYALHATSPTLRSSLLGLLHRISMLSLCSAGNGPDLVWNMRPGSPRVVPASK